jgi:hypothetical protein
LCAAVQAVATAFKASRRRARRAIFDPACVIGNHQKVRGGQCDRSTLANRIAVAYGQDIYINRTLRVGIETIDPQHRFPSSRQL